MKISLAKPFIDEDDIASVVRVLNSGWLTQGKYTQAFETAVAKFINAKYAIAVTSGTTGLHIALSSQGIGPGDEVIVPAFTWVATINAIIYTGATPVLVDVDKHSYNMNLEHVEKAITDKTKAIIPVHLFGLCADINSLEGIINKDIIIIEDAACALGATYDNSFAGTFGELGVFSFHPRKSVTTGEGGIITTNNYECYAKLLSLRNHGQSISSRYENIPPDYMPDCEILGYNYRLTDIQAALGVTQMQKLPSLLQHRKELAQRYSDGLAEFDWILSPTVPHNMTHCWQSYVIQLQEDCPLGRNEIMLQLKGKGIETRPGTHAIPTLSFHKRKLNLKERDYPTTMYCYQNTIALPIHHHMKFDDCDNVIQSLKEIFYA